MLRCTSDSILSMADCQNHCPIYLLGYSQNLQSFSCVRSCVLFISLNASTDRPLTSEQYVEIIQSSNGVMFIQTLAFNNDTDDPDIRWLCLIIM